MLQEKRSVAKVRAAVEQSLKQVIGTYSETDIAFTDTQLRTMVQSGSFDVLVNFSEMCRADPASPFAAELTPA